MDLVVLGALAAALLLLPGPVDRWAMARGARPRTLAALAAVTLAGLTALPIAFAVCASSSEADGDHPLARLTAVAGLLLVAVAAGRAVAHTVAVRRRWLRLRAIAHALDLPATEHGVKILPVPELLAFAAGTDAFVSEGLLSRLPAAERSAVLAHEHEHSAARHGRLLTAAGAIRHAWFGAHAARAAETALHRELDVLADDAAARGPGDSHAVREALLRLSVDTEDDDAVLRERLARLGARVGQATFVDRVVQATTVVLALLVLAGICVGLHIEDHFVGLIGCGLALGVFAYLTARPLAGRSRDNRTHPFRKDSP